MAPFRLAGVKLDAGLRLFANVIFRGMNHYNFALCPRGTLEGGLNSSCGS